VIEELRKLGNEVKHDWARGQAGKKKAALLGQKGTHCKTKKNSTGTPGLDG
jgi:hypothetical protein